MANTSNATETTRPAKLSPPSDRDLEIFKQAEIQHRTHSTIALDFELTRRRVSQIVQEVRHWLSLHGAEDPAISSEIQRQRYARSMERMHLQDIIQRAVLGLNNAPASLTTHIEGGPITKITRDQPSVDNRLLKTYLQAVVALGKLNDRPALPPPPTQREPWNHPKIQECVAAWRDKNDRLYLLKPEQYDRFAQELTATIQDCLAQGSPPTPSGTEVPDDCDSLNPEPQATASDEFDSDSIPHSALRIPHLLPSASHASLPETQPEDDSSSAASDLSACASDTYTASIQNQLSETPPQHPFQNSEKGSALQPPSASPANSLTSVPQLQLQIENQKSKIINSPTDPLLLAFIEEQNAAGHPPCGSAANRLIFQRYEEEDMRCFRQSTPMVPIGQTPPTTLP